MNYATDLKELYRPRLSIDVDTEFLLVVHIFEKEEVVSELKVPSKPRIRGLTNGASGWVEKMRILMDKGANPVPT